MTRVEKTPVLETFQLDIGYKQSRRPPKVVVSGIDVALREGEMACLIGPNGAGKSTLMRTLAGMQTPLAGQVNLLGDPVQSLNAKALARRLAIVLTERQDMGALTAQEVIALGRYPHTDWTGRLTDDDETAVQQAIAAVGGQELAQRNVQELSDGERQKIMIARALAQDSSVILLDEPTAFLDLPRRVEIMAMLRALTHDTGRAILLSTHDLDLALRTADTLWLLPMGGPLCVGAPEDLVLNGALAAAFRSEGVEFDMETGAFRMTGLPAHEIVLEGEGVVAIWTARALERAGFQVVATQENNSTQPQVKISDGSRWEWRQVQQSQQSENWQVANSIDELIKGLLAQPN